MNLGVQAGVHIVTLPAIPIARMWPVGGEGAPAELAGRAMPLPKEGPNGGR
jgi:hypothetical protein